LLIGKLFVIIWKHRVIDTCENLSIFIYKK